MTHAYLPDRALLALSGEDVIAFLQGLISNDARRLEKGEAIYAALLSPQGKFLHDFFLVPWNGKVYLDCEAARAEDLCKRLMLYKLRSKVTIESASEMKVAAVWDVRDSGLAIGDSEVKIFVDPRLPQLGFRVIGDIQNLPGEAGDYDRMRLSLGVPDSSRDMIVERSLLLECGFEELHGVDFNKGCYVGQEVTARSKFRAQLRKAFYIVQPKSGALPASGTLITADGKEAGQLRSQLGDIGMAILRAEMLQQGVALMAGDIAIEALHPSWAIE